MIQLINDCGGTIEDNLFVTDPGCKIIHITKTTPFANELFEKLNIESENEFESIGEFNARLCYLSFNTNNLTDTLISLGHLSVYNDIHITFLIVGVSDEVMKEFVSHNEAKVSRLTSSKTNKQLETLYRIFGDDKSIQIQKEYTQNFIDLRQKYISHFDQKKTPEIANMFNLGTKASAFTFSMNLKDFHKLFIGRMPENGNENDIRLVCKKMCTVLHDLFPKLIRTFEWYEKTNNNEKYEVN